MLLIFTVGSSEGLRNSTLETQSVDDVMPLEPETPVVRPIKPIQNTHDFNQLPVDTQVSSAPED